MLYVISQGEIQIWIHAKLIVGDNEIIINIIQPICDENFTIREVLGKYREVSGKN